EPEYTKLSTYQHNYTVTFQGVRHSLERWLLMDEGAFTFPYFGTLSEYMFMFLERVNSVDSGWTAGDLEELDPVAIDFDKVDCYSALNMIAEAFECEYQLIGKQITI